MSPNRKVFEIKAYIDITSGNTSIEMGTLRDLVGHMKIIEVFQTVS